MEEAKFSKWILHLSEKQLRVTSNNLGFFNANQNLKNDLVENEIQKLEVHLHPINA